MGISMNSLCIDCLFGKHLDNARKLGTEDQAMAFAKAIMQLFLDAAPEDNSAIMGQRINRLYMTHYGLPQDRFQEEKDLSNRFILDRMDSLRSRIEASENPVLAGLQYAILGNYIDFSALHKSVSFQALEQMLEHPEKFPIDPEVFDGFCKDLQQAKTMLYITDNAGELGFDLIFAQILQKTYPQLAITFCVRGAPAHNDATLEDFACMGIPFPVIDNGTDIGGTELSLVNEQTLTALAGSDIILSKGMGNTECLYGSGYPIYHAFLVKCPRFQQVFEKPLMTPMFLKEPQLKNK